MFSAVSPSILHGLPASSSRHVAAWRAQRIGYIRRPPEGCRACVSLGVQLVQYQIIQCAARAKPPRALNLRQGGHEELEDCEVGEKVSRSMKSRRKFEVTHSLSLQKN